MLKVRWTVKALLDLDDAQSYIAHENPAAAELVATRVRDAVGKLQMQPHMGNPAHICDARTWVVQHTPYLIVYRVRAENLEVLRIWHGKRNWKKT